MQFFHLFSFVVVASYAAALPQPAGQSEKYSNNVDTTLASGLEARSYQPVLNSQKDLATLTSLKRRDDSEGLAGEPSRSDPSPPFTSSLKEIDDSAVTESNLSTKRLASTIDKAENDVPAFYMDGELAGKRISGRAGDMTAEYIRKSLYVNAVLNQWVQHSVPGIRIYIKSGLSEDEYSKAEPDLTETIKKWENVSNDELKAIYNAINDIINDDGSAIENVEKISISFRHSTNSHWTIIWKLIRLLKKFEAGKTLEGQLDDIVESFFRFRTDQNILFMRTMKELGHEFFQ
ncbi:hypothetical protein BASA81_015029 [Batrachochytrium salamandrivorans]|nr:hypothetical protein BASA81_015029 [Batrachochytrium salamandrivorans]